MLKTFGGLSTQNLKSFSKLKLTKPKLKIIEKELANKKLEHEMRLTDKQSKLVLVLGFWMVLITMIIKGFSMR